jgi:putative lipoprotein
MRNIIVLAMLGFLATGCGPMENDATAPAADARGQVTGTIAFRERIILRPGTVVHVKLLQTSPADAAAKELATQVIENPAAPPIPFALEYDESAIDDRFSYSVRATVTRNDRLLLTTDTNYAVLTRGAGNSVDLMLVAPAAPPPRPDAPLTNTYWKLVGIGSESYDHNTNNREPRVRFGKREGVISGFTGCNEFTGGYVIDGDRLELDEIAATQKACLEGMEVEQRFLQALRRVNRFEISGDSLQLLQDDTPELAFEAVYLQ